MSCNPRTEHALLPKAEEWNEKSLKLR